MVAPDEDVRGVEVGEEQYGVEQLLQRRTVMCRRRGPRVQYLVKWQNRDDTYNSWESAELLKVTSTELVQRFEAKERARRAQRRAEYGMGAMEVAEQPQDQGVLGVHGVVGVAEFIVVASLLRWWLLVMIGGYAMACGVRCPGGAAGCSHGHRTAPHSQQLGASRSRTAATVAAAIQQEQ